MITNSKIKRLYDFITNTEYGDSEYWYIIGNIDVLKIFKDFDSDDIANLGSEVLKWNSEQIEILVECFIYGFKDEITFSKQSYFLTFLLANLKDESERLDILENASDVILKGEPKPIELLNSIINWIEVNEHNKMPYYNIQCSRIYEARKLSTEYNIIKQKISELRQEISSLTISFQAFDEIDGLSDKAINIIKRFTKEDFEQLKLDLILWDDKELEILAKVFSKGDSNGNLLDDNYFYGYLFVLLPASTARVLLDDMFYFFENQDIAFELLLQIKSKLNELIAKRYIERTTYEYWVKEITEKQKNCVDT
ncbi:hypothetical protein [Flavobacterium macacae]|uniref:Uncharacterized protein n=1 Tax=Flavobacterium macacae TaxID=2488993 RepID=A0A3P3WE27_9FLAO|nr:hypothetical protein [Flavobacterium macacae]RRJ92884.1 hypothetical protein EG849_04660 [Flavobacterium macacae]